MARFNLMIDDKLNEEFRKEVFNRMGMKRGNIQFAVEQALQDWINKKPTKGEKNK
jgi:hypothetical protein